MTNHIVTVIQLNDLHGYLEPHQELFWKGDKPVFVEAGGVARIATLIEEARIENPGGVILLDNGDTIHGTYPVVETKGEVLQPILKQLGFDAWTAHWDFAYDVPYLKAYANDLDYPLLSINCYNKVDNRLIFNPYRIIERHGIRIAIIGIAATIVDKVMPENFHSGVYFTLGEDELRKWVKHVREEEKAQMVIVLSHLGYPQELKMLSRVDGIDVFLSGHTHNRIRKAKLVNNSVIIQSGCHGSFLGRIDLNVSSSGKITNFKHRLMNVDTSIPVNEEISELVKSGIIPYRDMLSEVIGETKTDLYRNLIMESTMDNLLLQAIQNYACTDLVFSNGWRYGAPIPRGEITVEDIWNIIPVNPPISVCELTGQEIWDMIELNLERTFSPNPYHQMGGYVKRCMGLNLYFKIENPEGKRINRLFINGKPYKPEKTYTASYITQQGVRPEYGSNKKDLDKHAIDVLKKYIQDNKIVEAPLRNTIVPI
jgi:2',3'-cyclic-nucleotide 2'-phosphodiesterase (5'-nucleotidase family)